MRSLKSRCSPPGDEIVDIDAQPGPTQIRNSNSYSLAAQIQSAGGEPVLLPVAPDEPERLRELINDGLETDLLLLAGGVSMGKYDLVEQVLTELGAEFFLQEQRSNRENPSYSDGWTASISLVFRGILFPPW